MIWPFKKKEIQVGLLHDDRCRVDLREKYSLFPLEPVTEDGLHCVLIIAKDHYWIEPLHQAITDSEVQEIC